MFFVCVISSSLPGFYLLFISLYSYFSHHHVIPITIKNTPDPSSTSTYTSHQHTHNHPSIKVHSQHNNNYKIKVISCLLIFHQQYIQSLNIVYLPHLLQIIHHHHLHQHHQWYGYVHCYSDCHW